MTGYIIVGIIMTVAIFVFVIMAMMKAASISDAVTEISALFDARMDELRYRKENKETREKVFELDMRVDNLEKAIMPA